MSPNFKIILLIYIIIKYCVIIINLCYKKFRRKVFIDHAMRNESIQWWERTTYHSIFLNQFMTQPTLLIKGERKEKKKRRRESCVACVHRIEAIIEITVNDRQGQEDDVYPNLWRIHVYAGLRMHISQKFERFRVEIFSIELTGQMNRRDPVRINPFSIGRISNSRRFPVFVRWIS